MKLSYSLVVVATVENMNLGFTLQSHINLVIYSDTMISARQSSST